MPVLPSYRNQSIDFLYKSIDWFLYEGNTGILPFNDQYLQHTETSQLIYRANQLTGFYTMGTLVVKGLMG